MSDGSPGRLRLAIVVQRYGLEVAGGAEAGARALAERLQAIADVEVITTCALDYHTWSDHYPAGLSQVNGVPVHRFPVDAPRNWDRFRRQTFDLLHRAHSPAEEIAWMRDQGPYATPLFEYIEAHRRRFDFFLFFTYNYATAFFGLGLVPDRAIFIPTAHDEPTLYLPLYRTLFNLPRALVYLTDAERQIVERVTGNSHRPAMIAGLGVTAPADIQPARFRAQHGLHEPFLLYVGRIVESKNVPELLDHFQRFRATVDRPLKLVLVGQAAISIPRHPDILPLGFLAEPAKFDALAAASAVIVPSRYESLSLLALESWLVGTPVLANGHCAVLKEQCRRSNGGLYYANYEEFAQGLSWLLEHPDAARQLGSNGRRFTRANYDWPVIIARYQALLAALQDDTAGAAAPGSAVS